MDESIFGDLDTMALPELPDSVWMRMLANALDPDTPTTSLDLVPDDAGSTPDADDDLMLLIDPDADDLGDDGSGLGTDGVDDDGDDSDDGTAFDPYVHDHGAIPHPVSEHDALDSSGYDHSWHPDGDSDLGV